MAGPASDPLIGRILLGRYQIASFIREGGMASIYCGIRDQEPQHVAVKILNPELARQDQTFPKRFEREAETARRLQHPNIVEIFEIGRDGDLLFLVMELLVGEDLLVPLQRDAVLAERRVAKIMMQVCDALTHAHAAGVVHRDLKPENIMLIRSPRDPTADVVKVLDFGIAKTLDRPAGAPEIDAVLGPPSSARSMLTQVGTIVGTPGYMSPEQGRAEPVDARTDLYSCGVLMYELLTGCVPFDGETPMQVVMRHVNETPRPPRDIVEIHPDLEAIVLKALAKHAKHRHQTAAELREDLQRVLPELAESPRGARAPRAATGTSRAASVDTLESEVNTAIKESTAEPREPEMPTVPLEVPESWPNPPETPAGGPSLDEIKTARMELDGETRKAAADYAELLRTARVQRAAAATKPAGGGDALHPPRVVAGAAAAQAAASSRVDDAATPRARDQPSPAPPGRNGAPAREVQSEAPELEAPSPESAARLRAARAPTLPGLSRLTQAPTDPTQAAELKRLLLILIGIGVAFLALLVVAVVLLAVLLQRPTPAPTPASRPTARPTTESVEPSPPRP